MFIKIYLLILWIKQSCPHAGLLAGGCCWWTMELVPPGTLLGRVPCFPGGRGTARGILVQKEGWV